ncbi:hypothetical protein PR048_003789 [Dryococelus australis]|uniref:DDE-1 domain-containing protein n=1 Tax=Dryococelus australis TaxID=614101 RepID=A0ABQ9IP53_9NEOP|nr:hypothetical protein PR048_003789 [Dryococelus australis]
MKEELLDGAPPRKIAVWHPSGWMQADLFLQQLENFVHHNKPIKYEPILLLIDEHATLEKWSYLISTTLHTRAEAIRCKFYEAFTYIFQAGSRGFLTIQEEF